MNLETLTGMVCTFFALSPKIQLLLNNWPLLQIKANKICGGLSFITLVVVGAVLVL